MIVAELSRFTPERYGMSRQEQNRFSWQQSRLLTQSTLAIGLSGVIAAFICLTIPGTMGDIDLAITSTLLALLGVAHLMLSFRRNPLTMSAVLVLAMTTSVMILLSSGPDIPDGAAFAIVMTQSWAAGSLAPLLVDSWGRLSGLCGAFACCLLLLLVLDLEPTLQLSIVLYFVTAWGVSAGVGIWLNRSFVLMSRQVVSIGEAHRIERMASEVEAQRLREARLLHDTVLATLSMLAHGGAGVQGDALRQQAAADAELLERLRLGETPEPHSSGSYSLVTRSDRRTQHGDFASIIERFDQHGLSIDWHGETNLALPPARAEAIQLALTECLENVRRHAGTTQAQVTLSDDGVTIRVVVTDTGRGFDPAALPTERLGFRDSIVARVSDAGGAARVFSAPGAGTTV
ncbi:MAG: sensor histidine kinase, partial [Mycetocola sp.]